MRSLNAWYIFWELRVGTDERSPTSYPTLLDWRSRANSFSGLEGYDGGNFTVGLGDEARMLRGAQLTAGFFRLLGVQMAAGRDFLPEDATTGSRVAIVSERFARSVPGTIALNQTIRINGTPYVIVGVLPNTFHVALLQDGTSLCRSSQPGPVLRTACSALSILSGGFRNMCHWPARELNFQP